MVTLDGKTLGQKLKEEVKQQVQMLKASENIIPGLAVILVGEDPSSRIYVDNKKKACKEVDIYSEVINFSAAATQQEILEAIEGLNKDPKISGILVQLPLPKHLNERDILNAIKPKKDVDGFHPINIGKLCQGDPEFVPCTPQGVIELLKDNNIEIEGKEAVVVGRSNIVGKPMAQLLLKENATVTVCHSKTKGIEGVIKRADIVVVAIGQPRFLKGYMLKPGAVVVDVGVNRTDDGKVVGDADFESISKIAGYVTPVPGGIGPMTIAMLLKNTIKAARLNNNQYIG